MKIVDINPFFLPYDGGIEKRMRHTSTILSDKGHDVTVITSKLTPDAPSEERTEDGYRILRLDSKILNIYEPPFVSSKGLSEALESIDPDVVNYNYRWAPSYTTPMRKYDGKKVFTYHNMWGEGTGIGSVFSNILDNRFAKTLDTFDHIVAVSETVRKDLISRGYSPDHITTIPSCLEPCTTFPSRGETGDFALFVGRHVKTKGLRCLIEAMKYVDHRLLVCGEGPEDPHLEKMVAQYGLKDRVELLGKVSDEEKDRLMSECRMFVMPSLHESLGLAVVEALSFGAPIICSDADGLPDNVGQAGYIVPKNDPVRLAEAMNDLFDNPDKCVDYSAKSLKRAEYYSWDKHIGAIEDVYNKVLSGEYVRENAHRD
ncbi:MAG: glycosyltransferase family 4 protein [archaeon]|nr:glycosyltransferase family 4 protein [archaeon]